MSQSATPREANAAVRLADSVIRAGAMYSMAEDRKVYQSIAIRDEWIVAVSEDPHGLDELITTGTHVVDEPSMTIIPTFFDTHNHFIIAARNMGKVPADQAHNIAELVELIRQRAAQTPPGQWVQTLDAWHESNLAAGRLPDRARQRTGCRGSTTRQQESDQTQRRIRARRALSSPTPDGMAQGAYRPLWSYDKEKAS